MTTKLLLSLLAIIFSIAIYAQNPSTPCDCAHRWEKGAHWNPDGSINDANNAPDPKGIVRCGNSGDTESGIGPGTCLYDTTTFKIDLSDKICYNPNTGLPATVFEPVQGCPVIWLNFDARANAGSYAYQIVTNDNIGWALYYSNVHTAGLDANGLSGDCSDLIFWACGDDFNNTWAEFLVPSFTVPTNLYLAVWDQDCVDSGTYNTASFSINFKARQGCGESILCILETGIDSTYCNGDGTYTVEVPIVGANGDFVGTDPNATPTISPTVTLGNLGSGGPTSGTIVMTYPVSVTNYSILIYEDSTDNTTIPTNSSECQNTINGIAPNCCLSLGLSISVDTLTCYGDSNATATVTPSAGIPPYTFQWDASAGNQISQTASNLAAGTYGVTVTDSTGCPDSTTVTVIQPDSLSLLCSGTNISCFNGTDGTASVAVSGGTAPYSYSWSNGGNTNSISGLGAGTYTVTVTDDNGCSSSCSITLTEPASFTCSIVSDTFNCGYNISCNGATDGNAIGNVSGGTGPYTFSWSTGSNNDTILGLGAGTYTLTVTDANGCSNSCSITLTEPAALSCSIDSDTLNCGYNISCNGATDGNAESNVTGGCMPYTYSWSNGGNTANITGLGAGTYDLTVTDANGCTTSCSVTLTEPQLLTCSIQSDTFNCGNNVSVNGGNDGNANSTASGGCAPYSYSWSNGGNTANLTGLGAGTYDLTVTDANGCTTSCSVILTEPQPLTCSVNSSTYNCGFNISCNGATDGDANSTVNGGCAPYSYSWSNAGNTANLIGLGAGTYDLTVTDANGATTSCSVTLTEPQLLTCSIQSDTFNCGNNVSVNGGNDGNANSTVNGGCTPYSYSWSNGGNTANLTGLGAGTYDLTVTDTNGCTTSCSITLTEPQPLTCSVNSSTYNCGFNVSCNGATDGNANSTVNGGCAPYTYSWSNAGNTANLTGLGAGTYDLTVTDANGATTSCSVTLTQPQLLTCSINSSTYNCGFNISCNGATDGDANSTVNGGCAPYSYSWSNAGNTANLTGLGAGTYDLTVTDANGCTTSCSVTLTEPQLLTCSIQSDTFNCGNNVSVNGGNDGNANSTVNGGCAPYSYSWSNGGNTANLTGLGAGTYDLTVTDANGCTTSCSVTLTEPQPLTCSVNSSTYNCGFNISCNGATDGDANSTVNGGCAPYSYSWSNGGNTANLTGLGAGTYDLTVTDANGATTSCSVTLTEPQLLTCSIQSDTFNCGNNVSVNGGNDGNANSTVNGGCAPYSYSWSNGGNTANLTGLGAGTYDLTVTDANGCTTSCSVTLTEPTQLTCSIASDTFNCGYNISCNGAVDGNANSTVNGGCAPYTYSWSNGGNTANLNGLGTGTYDLTVTDANGNTTSCSVTLTEPQLLTCSINSSNYNCGFNVSCNGATDGDANSTVNGGCAPYSYSWSNGGNTANLSSIGAGTYDLTVTDANGCTTSCTVTLTQPQILTCSIQSDTFNCGTNISVAGGSDGNANSTVNGGCTPYSYSWSNGGNTANLTGLGAGTYTLTVTDDNGCTTSCSITLTEPTQLTCSVSSDTFNCGYNISCNGATDGNANSTVNGGCAPYTYSWSNGGNTANLIGLGAGTYDLTVTDANGATTSCSVTLTEPQLLTCSINSSTYNCGFNVSCNGATDGDANSTVNGGCAPYSYSWSNAGNTANLTGLGAGTYDLTVTDANGCTTSCTVTLTQPQLLTCSIQSDTFNCGYNISVAGGSDGNANSTVNGGCTPYSYSWSNGGNTANLTGLSAGTYTLIVTDDNGCTTSCSVTLTEPTQLTCSIASDTFNCGYNISCNGDMDGNANSTVTGGCPPYSYAWSNGPITANLINLGAGTYTLTVSDANGNTTTCSITLTQPLLLSCSIASDTFNCGYNISCNGVIDGNANSTVNGGCVPYSYSWSNGGNTADLSNIGAGTYDLTVTDANGCTTSCSVTLTEPQLLTCSIQSDTFNCGYNISCNGANDGDANSTVNGGCAPYTYSWSNGGNTANLSSIGAGTYDLTVTDANGCTTSCSVTLTEPQLLTCSIQSDTFNCGTNISVAGGSDGNANSSVNGGCTPYSYSWSNGGNTANLTGLSAGTYTLTVTDDNGCTTSCSITLTEPTQLTCSIASDTFNCGYNISCNGASDGNANSTVNGGCAPYTYSWSNAGNTANLTGLGAGTYDLTVTDANGATTSCSVTLTEPLLLTCSIASDTFNCGYNISCNGVIDGNANSTVNGGCAPYSYSWSNGGNTANLTGLGAGTYDLTVTDANGCTTSCSVTLTEPQLLTCSIQSDTFNCGYNISCNGANDGNANSTVNGGCAPYSYSWSNGGNTANLSSIGAGTYGLTVTDANGCTTSCSVTLTEPQLLTCSIQSDTFNCGNNVSVNGGNDGNANSTVNGGCAPYSYSWSNGGNTANLTGLGAGTYDLTVTDANGCTTSCSITLTEPQPLTCSVNSSTYNCGFNASCNGATDGDANSTVNGGCAPYSYSWSNAGNTANLTGLGAGTYDLTVTDANGATTSCSVTLNQPQLLTCSINSSTYNCGFNISCNGATDGDANSTVNGGCAPYSYSWSNAGNTANLTGLGAGTYDLTVTDANGCTTSCSVTLTEPQLLTCSIQSDTFNCGTNISVTGGSDGNANSTVNGGCAPFSYSWSNGGNTANLTGLGAGTYDLTVTDANGCTTSCSITLTEPQPLTCSVNSSTYNCGFNVSCNGATDGDANSTVNGGCPPYSYSWSNAGNTANLTGLGAGTYDLTVTDANGATTSCSVTLTQPQLLTCSINSSTYNCGFNISCNGATDGAANSTVNGGCAPYSYSWSNGGNTANLTGLGAGTYDLTVTDANGCTTSCSVTLTQPQLLTCSIQSDTFNCGNNISVNGGNDGNANSTVNGGCAPYSYSWSNGGNTANLTGLGAGTYGLTVTDVNGCTTSCSVTLTEPIPLSCTITASNFGCGNGVSCNGASDGITASTVNGGCAPYSYSWSNGGNTANLTGLNAGTYDLTVTDANGATTSCSVTLNEPQVISCIITPTIYNCGFNISCNGVQDANLVSSTIGGCAPYSYNWSNGSNSPNINGLGAGTYTLTVSDINGCSSTCTITLTEPQILTCSILSDTFNCGFNVSQSGGNDGNALSTVSGGCAPYSYNWSTGSPLPNLGSIGAGTYTLTVTDANGCTTSCSITLTEPQPLTCSVNSSTYNCGFNVSCNGASDGDANSTVNGGCAPYSYSWSNGGNTANLNSIGAGTYDMTVTDANGTTTSCSVTLTQPQLLTCSVNSSIYNCGFNISCNGATDGDANSTVNGGCAPYSYSWSNGGNIANLSSIGAGTYDLTVTDANGCTTSCSVTLTEPQLLTCSIQSDTFNCGTNISVNGGNDGNANSTVNGGCAPYSYSWSNGGNTANLTGLGAGTYDLTVTDANGCTTSCSIILTEPDPLVCNITSAAFNCGTNVSCNGALDGNANSTVSGGCAPYTYSWSNGGNTANLSSIGAGTYDLTVTDANGNTTSCSITLTEPLQLTCSIISSTYNCGFNISCNGAVDGDANSTVNGGCAPYSYSWPNGGNTANLNSIGAGTYDLTVTDANGCTTSCSVTLTEPQILTCSIVSDTFNCGFNVSQNGATDGNAESTVSGGCAPYSYSWSNGGNTANLSGLGAGTYDLTVTDANGCTTSCSVTLTEPQILTCSISSAAFNCGTNVTCNGAVDGNAISSVSGGCAPYSYNWSNGQQTTDLNGIGAGTYNLTVTDANGATTSCSVTLTEPQLLICNIESDTFNCGNNISVNGGNDGNANSTVNGGCIPYSYNWSNGQQTANLNGIGAGTYTLTVTDANGCSTSCSVTLTEPDPLICNISSDTFNCGTNVSCNGANDGNAVSSVNGGCAPYSYAWSNQQTTADLNGIGAGIYELIITDANGNTTSCSITLTEPAFLTCNLTSNTYNCGTNISCNGALDGNALSNVAGGCTPYSYAWSNGAQTADLNGVGAGTYDLTVTDANGCSSSCTITLTEPALLTITVSSDTFNCGTNVSCNGASDGNANSSVTGGCAPYTYLWSNQAVTANISGLGAGTYSLTVTDANGCTATTSITLTEPTIVALSIASNTFNCGTNVSCNGAVDGNAISTVTGGCGPYTYFWSNQQTTADLNGLGAGTYSLTVTDANGCTASATVTLTEPALLTCSIESDTFNCGYNVSQNGATDGNAESTVIGGCAPYSFAWSNGQQTANLNGIGAGTYTLTVTDANGCTTSCSVTLTEPDPLTCNISSATYNCGTNISCNGALDGNTVSSVNGGCAPYSYTWSNGAQTSGLNGVGAGTYNLTVTDANGITTSCSITLTEPALLTASISSDTFNCGTNVSCNGAIDGNALSSIGGGCAPYSYNWSNGQQIADLNGIGAGTYSLTVTDDNGCTTSASITLTEPTLLTVSISSDTFNCGTNVSCNSANDGNAISNVNGGCAPYTYAWSNQQITADLNGIGAGTYSLTVTDANGCSASATITLTEPTIVSVNIITGTIFNCGTNVSCFGANDGNAISSVSGGCGPYTYIWSNQAVTPDLNMIGGGTYTLTVTDANGCTATASITLTEPQPLICNLISATYLCGTNVSCNGANDGNIASSLAGGCLPYSYLWSNGQQTANLNGISAGTYTLTVTDANGCTTACSITLTEPDLINVNITSDTFNCGYNVSCNGAVDGNALSAITGGCAPYTYLWSNQQNNTGLNGISAGTYSLTVTDANGCTGSSTITLTEPDTFATIFTLSVYNGNVNVSCFGATDGSINLNVTGGCAPYNYQWSTNDTTQNLSNLVAGWYYVTITDANGCSTEDSVELIQPQELTLTSVITNVSCNGVCDGAIDITLNGGTAPYTYAWSNNSFDEDPDSLCAGTYTVTVTDANGCVITDTIIVTQPLTLNLQSAITHVSCFSLCDGAIDLTVSGGTAPYTYSWSTNDNTEDIDFLCAGIYSVTVTDVNGCTAVLTDTVTEPDQILVSGIISNPSCAGIDNGSIDITVTGGTGPYTYSWSNGEITQDISGLGEGLYIVTVTDANGCERLMIYILDYVDILTIQPTLFNEICGLDNGIILLNVVGGSGFYSYIWSSGSTSQNVNNLNSGLYSVTVQDSVTGCIASASYVIEDVEGPEIIDSINHTLSCGTNDGSIYLTVSGGSGDYSYSWSNGDTTSSIVNLSPGVYTVFVTDNQSGCSSVDEYVILESNTLSISDSVNAANCGFNDGSIYLTVSGGSGPYSYNWSNGANTSSITGLSSGLYAVTVSDDNSNCQDTLLIVVTNIGGPVITLSSTNVSCAGGSNGSISSSVTGGSGTYYYFWTNSATSASINNLSAGIYHLLVIDSATGCIDVATAIVTQPDPLKIEVDRHYVQCYNEANGAIGLTVTGGTAGYNYIWSNGDTVEDINGLTAGTYTVSITDINGCSVIVPVEIIQPDSLVVKIDSITPESCNSSADGAISISVSGGTLPYSYIWSNGDTSASITGLGQGSYTVTVTDGNGCTEVIAINVGILDPIMASAVISNVPCPGGSNGSINLTVVSGTANIVYLWSDGSINEDLNNVGAGVYTVFILDTITGCHLTMAYTVTEATFYVSSAIINASCGSNNGEIHLIPQGGSGLNTYGWAHGPSGADLTGLAPGTYTVTVTDTINNCVITDSFVVENIERPTVTGVVTDASSCGAANGSIDITVAGPNTYSFIWSNSAVTEDINNLTAGIYTVTVTDDTTGCEAVTQFTVEEINTLAVSAIVNDASCGQQSGMIDLTVTGGAGSYTYNWSTGATTEDIAGLSAGVYLVTVTDQGSNCTIEAIFTVNNKSAPSVSFNSSNVTCAGAGDGSIQATATGGSGNYSYLWSNGATTANISGLNTGTYILQVTDTSSGCLVFGVVTITEPTVIDIVADRMDVSCNGGSDGSIDLYVTGGMGTYSYAWSNNAFTPSISGLVAGFYSVTVTDTSGCTNTLTIEITEPVAITTIVTSKGDVSCGGAIDGFIQVQASGGTPPYTYIMFGQPVNQNGLFTQLSAGIVTIFIIDSLGCTDTLTDTIQSIGEIDITGSITHILCIGGNTGAIDITVTGGTGNYNYLWSTGATTQDISNLIAGLYVVYVTDTSSGCMANAVFTVLDSTIGINAVVNQTVCGDSTGSISLTLNGGSGNFNYAWSNGAVTALNSNLAAGIYNVTVTDDITGCTVTGSYTLLNTDGPEITGITSNANCGASDGSVTITVTGGVPPYTFVWSNSAVTQNLTNIPAGIYTVTVTDADGCSNVASFTVANNDGPQLAAVITDANCNSNDGSIVLTVTNGSGSYSYNWSNGGTTDTLTNLGGGTYIVTVTDLVTGCEAIGVFNVDDDSSPIITLDALQDEGCAGSNDGSIDISVSGGSGNYSYNWSHGAVTEDITNLPPAVYVVIVKDLMTGCEAGAAYTILPATGINMGVSVEIGLCEENEGSISLTIAGGASPYTINWTGPGGFTSALQNINNLATGTYQVTVTDQNGCVVTESIFVDCNAPDEPNPIIVYNVITPNDDGANDYWIIENFNSDLYPNNEVLIFNRWGDQVYHAKPYNNEWDGKLNDTNERVPDGSYFYILLLNENVSNPINEQQEYAGYIVVKRQ